jgi:hypothetical protein
MMRKILRRFWKIMALSKMNFRDGQEDNSKYSSTSSPEMLDVLMSHTVILLSLRKDTLCLQKLRLARDFQGSSNNLPTKIQ